MTRKEFEAVQVGDTVEIKEKQTINFVECEDCEHNINEVCDFMKLKIVGYTGEDIPCGDYI